MQKVKFVIARVQEDGTTKIDKSIPVYDTYEDAVDGLQKLEVGCFCQIQKVFNVGS